jgi:hypothetical protein
MLVISCSSCGLDGDTSVTTNKELSLLNQDISDQLYDKNHLLTIEIEMDANDYDTLRVGGRSLPAVFVGCFQDPDYRHFNATVTVDGQKFHDVDIRKKGFLGSLSAARPSFKLDFNEYVKGRAIKDMTSMTLNNNRQDPGNTHQCITYDLFRQAGLIAPRCNFAHVFVNGEDLGIYTNVEAVNKSFLKRNFLNADGNLYEAQIADFGFYSQERYLLKNNINQNDRFDLIGVVNALEQPNNTLPQALDKVVDLDYYIRFWAMEILTGHWDGANGNRNNHFIYNNPGSSKFYFIPWGADAAMEGFHTLNNAAGPIYQQNFISSRLYAIDEYRNVLHQRLMDFADRYWDEEALLLEVGRIQTLTDSSDEDLAQVRSFINSQRQTLEDAINEVIPAGSSGGGSDSPLTCHAEYIKPIIGSFNANAGSFSFINHQGEIITETATVSQPTINESINNALFKGVSIELKGSNYKLVIYIEEADFGNIDVYFQGFATSMLLYEGNDIDGYTSPRYGGGGVINFTQVNGLDQDASATFIAKVIM